MEITQKMQQNINKKVSVFEESYDFDDLVYEALDIQYGNKTIGEILEKANTARNPNYYSYLLTLNAPSSKLLKGFISVNDEKIFYSWVEKEEFVYDVVTKKLIYKDFFYETFKPEVTGLYHASVFKKDVIQFCVGIKTVEDTPELVKEFLSYEGFNKIKPKTVLKILTEIDNEQTQNEVLKFYNIQTDLGHNI